VGAADLIGQDKRLVGQDEACDAAPAARITIIFKKKGAMGGFWPATTRRTPHGFFY